MNQALGQLLDRTQEQSPSQLLLSLEDVTVRYDVEGQPIVQGIHFSLYEGQSVLFLGPSGCGKSTLAMLCGGLIPISVEAQVSGQVWRHPCLTHPGQVGYVFQDPEAQFCMMTVADEIAFGLENLSVPREQMLQRIGKSLADASLRVSPDDAHHVFSGGMKQKLALACALALEPSLLIFDEPTANLDPFSTRQVFQQILSLRDCKQTMIVIEHKFEVLVPKIDQVVIFDHHGRIHRTGPALQVVQQEWDWLVDEGIVDPWRHPPENPEFSQPPSSVLQKSRAPAQSELGVPHSNRIPACRLEHASLWLSKKPILNDINLSIPTGEFVAIVGPNGAGKSSLLQMSAGLQRSSTGIVELFGKPVRKMTKRGKAQRVAYCFQNPEFQFIYESVGDELANRRVGTDVSDKVRQLLDAFGLSGTELQSPFSLSQGQKRRLSVAAMVRDPHDIYFLDEPTFGQDAKTKETIMNHLWDLHETGCTIVMTTHDMDLVERFATDVIVVVNGDIRFRGTPHELRLAHDVLAEAHLLDDLTFSRVKEAVMEKDWHLSKRESGESPCEWGKLPAIKTIKPPIRYFHPVWLLLGLMIVAGITFRAQTLIESVVLFGYAIVLLVGIAWMTPWKIVKILAPFIVFYAIYIWTFAANAAIPPGTKTVHLLWWALSFYGVKKGIILTFRMLASVLFGVLYIWNMDISDLMVGLSKDMRIPPKFAYGTLAGLRVVPLFSAEWMKLRQARQLRGKDAKLAAFRLVAYAIPLLSQAIRMSERVAIAMEARGMIGDPADHSKGRTYFRPVPIHWWDFAAQVVLILTALLCLWVF